MIGTVSLLAAGVAGGLLAGRVLREPHVVIGKTAPGGDYLRRWWILPKTRGLNIYLHNMRRSDDDRALHDHRSWNISIVLRGGYWEWMPAKGGDPADAARFRRVWRGPGSIVFRPAKAAHRLERGPRASWSIFITGPHQRDWGFHCPKGWVPWADFVDDEDSGEIGRGCGE